MTLVAIATAVAAVLGVLSMLWALWVLFDIGSDGLGAGPWTRPEPRQPHSRLPADFVGLWSLFGSRSIQVLTGSRESALRRLARLEATIRGLDPDSIDPDGGAAAFMSDTFEDGWLDRRLDRLETLAGITPLATDQPAGGADATAPIPPPEIARGRT